MRIAVIGAKDTLGKLTSGIGGNSVWMKNLESVVIRSLVPWSKIKGLANAKLIEVLEEKKIEHGASE